MVKGRKFMGYTIYKAKGLETETREYYVPEYRMAKELGLDIRVVSYDKEKKTWAIFIWARPEELEKTLLKALEVFGLDSFMDRERVRIIPFFNVDRRGRVYVEGYHVVVVF